MVSKVEHRTRTGCPIACSLDVLGDHWTLLIVRNLMFTGAHEYKDMLAAEEKISSSILSDRLKKMESDGLIASIGHPENKRRKLYFLTPVGKDLIHVMTAMAVWADRHLGEFLTIPKEAQAQLRADPDGFKKQVLAQLSDWESKNIGQAAENNN